MAPSEKARVRAELRHRRASVDADGRARADAAIARLVMASTLWDEADLIYTYLSVRDEVDTRAIVRGAWECGKRVVVPRMAPGRRMRWFEITSFSGLEQSSFGIEEPVPDVSLEVSDVGSPRSLAFVPGVAFDRAGYRMGYGGGYYDVFLAGFEGVAVGLCRSWEVVEAMPCLEAHDLAVDVVVTDDTWVAMG